MTQESKIKVSKMTLLAISIGLFGISLTQSAYHAVGEVKGADSPVLLLWGWMGFFAGEPSAFIWLANPLLGLCWGFVWASSRVSLIMSVVCVGTMLAFLSFSKMPINENGKYELIAGYDAGYWLWVSSAAILCIGNTGLALCDVVRAKPGRLEVAGKS